MYTRNPRAQLVPTMMSATEMVLFESSDGAVTLSVEVDPSGNDAWLTQAQMAMLFDTTKQNVSLHLGNCFKEGELDRTSVVKDSLTTASDGKRYRTKSYALDAIISVGYRVKSQRGVEFRRWATNVLHRYIVEGHAEYERRLRELGQAVGIMIAESRPQEKEVMVSLVMQFLCG